MINKKPFPKGYAVALRWTTGGINRYISHGDGEYTCISADDTDGDPHDTVGRTYGASSHKFPYITQASTRVCEVNGEAVPNSRDTALGALRRLRTWVDGPYSPEFVLSPAEAKAVLLLCAPLLEEEI